MILVHASLIPKRQNTSILTPQKRNRDVLKIPRKASLKKMRGYPSFKISFFSKVWRYLDSWSLSLFSTRASVSKSRKTFLGTVDSEAQEFDKVG